VAALDRHGLLKSSEYLESGFCHRDVPYDYTKHHPIRGFRELINFVKMSIFHVDAEPTRWREEVSYIRKTMQEYLENI
jgi:hypothetical protein